MRGHFGHPTAPMTSPAATADWSLRWQLGISQRDRSAVCYDAQNRASACLPRDAWAIAGSGGPK